jgi:hypothetical protein
MEIIKNDGRIEQFNARKLEISLERSGASATVASKIREKIEATSSGTTGTHELYRKAFSILRNETHTAATRYSLRRALFEIGPSGHPFEDFVSELFKKEGWEVLPRQIIPGSCVSHEVDVYAKRNGEYLFAELKYHNDPGYKTDVKVALYVKARFDDIMKCDPAVRATCPITHGYLVTNTKFTSQATQFAECSGINLIGWSYPAKGNLYDRIISSGLYPVTVLSSLRKSEKRLLIDRNISTTELVKQHREILREIGIPPERLGKVIAEIQTLENS